MDALILLGCVVAGWWLGRGHITGVGYAPRDRIDRSHPVHGAARWDGYRPLPWEPYNAPEPTVSDRHPEPPPKD